MSLIGKGDSSPEEELHAIAREVEVEIGGRIYTEVDSARTAAFAQLTLHLAGGGCANETHNSERIA